MRQSDLFGVQLDEPSAVTKKPRTSRAKPSLEDMAAALEHSGDYRVLRRLPVVTDWGTPQGSVVADTRCVLIIDTETTGLSHANDRIIELAMLRVHVDLRTGRPLGQVQTFSGFEDPGMPIPEVARQVTGITDDDVRGQRLDDERVAALLEGVDVVIAHNAAFDRPFLEARFTDFERLAWACSFAEIDWKARGAESAKLGALALDGGWFYDAHRALIDCHALLQVLVRPVEAEAADVRPSNGLLSLLQAARLPNWTLRALGAPFDRKDALKARGYRWDTEAKVWWCTVRDEGLLATELTWLGAEIYRHRGAEVELERRDARQRFALRAGVVERVRL